MLLSGLCVFQYVCLNNTLRFHCQWPALLKPSRKLRNKGEIHSNNFQNLNNLLLIQKIYINFLRYIFEGKKEETNSPCSSVNADTERFCMLRMIFKSPNIVNRSLAIKKLGSLENQKTWQIPGQNSILSWKFVVDMPPPLCRAISYFSERAQEGFAKFWMKVISPPSLKSCSTAHLLSLWISPCKGTCSTRFCYDPVLLLRYGRRWVPFTTSLSFSWSLCSVKPKGVSFSRQVCKSSQSAIELNFQGHLG